MKTLKDFRESIGKSQKEMADELNISKSYYEKVESGERTISRELIERIKERYPIIDLNIFLKFNHTERVASNTSNTPTEEPKEE